MFFNEALEIKFRRVPARAFVWTLCLLLSLVCAAGGQNKSKIKPEEIVAKHVEAIGTAEARSAAINRMIQGKSHARVVQLANSTIQGKSLLASTADRMLLQMSFEVAVTGDYSREQISFDGREVNAPFITESKRSGLGTFVFRYKEIIKQGFFGGSLFSSWALLDVKNKIGKLSYDGTEKIGERETHVLKCVPRGGSALNIKLYFDAQTFQHLRTTYAHSVSPAGIVSDEGRITETRYRLVEDFSDYRQISGLALPTTYKINLTVESYNSTNQFEWLLTFSRFAFNQPIEDNLFK
jgi:hypothetical protein